jgi:hypothetical protein
MKIKSVGDKSENQKAKDLTKVNGNDMNEVLWWSSQLGVAPEKLFSLIKDAGDSSEKIRNYIKTMK